MCKNCSINRSIILFYFSLIQGIIFSSSYHNLREILILISKFIKKWPAKCSASNSDVCGDFFPHHQATLWHCLPSLWFNSILTLFTWDSGRSHRLRARGYKTVPPTPLQMLITTPGHHLCFWLNCYKSEGPTTPHMDDNKFVYCPDRKYCGKTYRKCELRL